MDDLERIAHTRVRLIFVQVICILISLGLAAAMFATVKRPAAHIAWRDEATINDAIGTLACIGLGMFAFGRLIAPAIFTESMKKKLVFYKRAQLTRTLLILPAATVPSILVMFENCYAYFLFPGIGLLMLFLTWPTVDNIKDHLRVNL